MAEIINLNTLNNKEAAIAAAQKVIESQYFTFGFCFIDLPRYQLIPG